MSESQKVLPYSSTQDAEQTLSNANRFDALLGLLERTAVESDGNGNPCTGRGLREAAEIIRILHRAKQSNGDTLVDDLRVLEKTWPSPICGRAADEIERLRRKVERASAFAAKLMGPPERPTLNVDDAHYGQSILDALDDFGDDV